MTYRTVYWDDKNGRLKSFSASTKADGVSIVKVEIEIRDLYQLTALLRDLGDIRQAQAAKKAAAEPKRTASRCRAIESQSAPLMLTYRED